MDAKNTMTIREDCSLPVTLKRKKPETQKPKIEKTKKQRSQPERVVIRIEKMDESKDKGGKAFGP